MTHRAQPLFLKFINLGFSVVFPLNDYRGFEGSDASLAESLYCYGLIWQKRKGDKNKTAGTVGKDYYHFIYGIDHDDGDSFLTFDWANIDVAINNIGTNIKIDFFIFNFF